MTDPSKPWDGAIVRTWLDSRIAAARADQAVAQRQGRAGEDDCDQASAEEMVCSVLLRSREAIDLQGAFAAEVKGLLDRDDYVWRGVYDDRRFDRHVRTYIRKLAKMTKTNMGFENIKHYQ